MWAIILHGGAKEIEPEEAEANRSGCLRALAAGQAVLERGASAVDAAEAALRVLEDDPIFNCGYGSIPNRAGEVEMCAAVMEGQSFNVGAVGVVQGVRNPVSVARAMLEEETILIAGPGARDFAAEKGLELCDPVALKATSGQKREKAGAHDTVGCVALDRNGLLVAATSTGGLEGTPVGRMGDSAMPGCGYYADNSVGAVAFSGDGEHIARKMLAARVMHALGQIKPDAALELAVRHVADIGGEAGGIVLTPDGRFGWMHNSREFAVAYASSERPEPQVFLSKEEEQAQCGT
ncbi:isoaspartyl peptidase/L-asparaginase family protein [Paracoccus niistensis]|uniref:Isoaspartyl peptidase/L-asparaginase family protein n=1 Tax=Paracoccus niistensis TaxID=632935 RepID=A0ABV6I514_9RHOB